MRTIVITLMIAVLALCCALALAQVYAQERALREISGAAGHQCEPFAVFERCAGSDALFDQRYGCDGERERISLDRCTPEGWLRVRSIDRIGGDTK